MIHAARVHVSWCEQVLKPAIGINVPSLLLWGVGGNSGLISAHRSVKFGSVSINCGLWKCDGCRELGPKRDKVTMEWRKIQNEDLNNLYCSSHIVRVIKSRMRWVGHVARMGERRDVYRVLVGKPEGKRPRGRPRRGWEDNIKMDLQDVGCGVWTGSSWFGLEIGGGHL